MKKPYITDSKIKETIAALKNLFKTEASLIREVNNSLNQHPPSSREAEFFRRVLEELK